MRAIRVSSALLGGLLVVGCPAPPSSVAETDARALSESENFAHIVDALNMEALGGRDLTLGEFLANGNELDFDRAPDPTQLLLDTAASDDDLSSEGRQPLSVLSLNVGLLDFAALGQTLTAPFLEERRGRLPSMLFETGADIIMVQELWAPADVQHFTDEAQADYVAFNTERSTYNDGLATYLRRDLVGDADVTADELEFSLQDPAAFSILGVKRAAHLLRFEHPDFGDVLVVNTHLASFAVRWKDRIDQSRQLSQSLADHSDAETLVLLAGDLNAGPYYKNDEWVFQETSDTSWWENTLSYPTLLEYGGLQDLFIMGRSLEDADADVTLGDTVLNDAYAGEATPGVEEGWCESTPHIAFTASDCNSLYFSQYAGIEYPARIDHVLGRAADGRIKVDRAELVFTEAVSFGDVEAEPSDHYGVRVDLLVTPLSD